MKAHYKVIDFKEPIASASIINHDRPKTAREIALEQKSYAEGFSEAEQRYKQLLQRIENDKISIQNEFFVKIESEFQKFRDDIIQSIPSLLMALVKKIWSNVAVDSQIMKGIVDQMVQEWSPKDEPLEVIVCSSDLEKIKDSYKDQYSLLKFVSNDELKPGDCLIRSRFGVVDGRIETKINTATSQITEQ